MYLLIASIILCLSNFLHFSYCLDAPSHPNILYLMSDDMRPQLGCYGQSFMRTPNLDALSSTALHFDFAYTNFAYCAPSRNSFMSGRRPERTKALNFLTTFRKMDGANWTAMPQFFKKNGYFTSSAGKIYHDGMDDKPSWTYPSNQTQWIGCGKGDLRFPNGNYCGVTENSTTQYTDEDLALTEGLKRMDLAVASGKPWWVSIGFHRPHTNYRVPKGFYGPDIYPNDSPDMVFPPKFPGAPEGAPFMSGNWDSGDINDPAHGCPTCIVPDVRSIEYRRWYYAAVTWVDHNIGVVLGHLQDLGVENNTIVVFHSDHGYQLGELNEWSKKTNTELATHVPLLIRVPWKEASQGVRTTVKAELVDMYKTLAELTGLGPVENGVQGTSLAPVFDSPINLSPKFANKIAYSQIGRCSCGFVKKYNVTECDANACCDVPLAQFNYMGYTMRTTDYRFTAWVPFDKTTLKVDWSRLTNDGALELFNLTSDTGRSFDYPGYSHNLVNNPAYQELKKKYLEDLKDAVQSWY